VVTYRVWRSVDAGKRILIGTVAAADPLRNADANIKTGHTYHYFVTAVGAGGVRVAKTNVANVYVVRAPQTLAFGCQLVTVAAATDVSCHWSATGRPAAIRYVLWRSVDGAARTAVYRTGIHGKRTYIDAAVTAGQTVRYAVVALDIKGHIVAYGSPVTVHLP
jgi:fibronectin type 3 domain-containing protein